MFARFSSSSPVPSRQELLVKRHENKAGMHYVISRLLAGIGAHRYFDTKYVLQFDEEIFFTGETRINYSRSHFRRAHVSNPSHEYSSTIDTFI